MKSVAKLIESEKKRRESFLDEAIREEFEMILESELVKKHLSRLRNMIERCGVVFLLQNNEPEGKVEVITMILRDLFFQQILGICTKFFEALKRESPS